MATLNTTTDEIRAFPNGHIYVCDPDDAVWPEQISDTLNNVWKDVGYTTDDGVKFTFATTATNKMAWQTEDPVRVLVTNRPKSLSFSCEQWNATTLGLALGGIIVVQDVEGQYTIEPQIEGYVDFRSVIIEVNDGDLNYRFGYRKVQNQSSVEFSAVRKDTADLPIELTVLAAGVDDAGAAVKPWFIQTDDVEFDAAVSA